jgi:hypothetical protein
MSESEYTRGRHDAAAQYAQGAELHELATLIEGTDNYSMGVRDEIKRIELLSDGAEPSAPIDYPVDPVAAK